MEWQHGMLSPHASKTATSVQALSHSVANSLRASVGAYARRGQVPPEHWRYALRLVCEDAQRSEVPIEQLLVALKQALVPLSDVFGVPYGRERAAFISRLVSMCIEEFYRARER